MRPDGAGTDERLKPEERKQLSKKLAAPTNALEADVFKLAVIFALISLVVWGTVFLSQRATMPDLSENNPSLQE